MTCWSRTLAHWSCEKTQSPGCRWRGSSTCWSARQRKYWCVFFEWGFKGAFFGGGGRGLRVRAFCRAFRCVCVCICMYVCMHVCVCVILCMYACVSVYVFVMVLPASFPPSLTVPPPPSPALPYPAPPPTLPCSVLLGLPMACLSTPCVPGSLARTRDECSTHITHTPSHRGVC